MTDGRTNVTVTVTRADGKSASFSWFFTVGESRYQLYFGQLHSHTQYSDGAGSLESALSYVKNLPDSANVQFVAFTDHSNYFDKSGAANPEGAGEFIEFLLSPEVQADIPGEMYMYPAVRSTELPAEWVQFAPLSDNPFTVPATEIAGQRDSWIRTWTSTVVG